MTVQVWYEGYEGWFDYAFFLTEEVANLICEQLNSGTKELILRARMKQTKQYDRRVVYPPVSR